MEKFIYNDKEAIVLFVALPDCTACSERIQELLDKMNCWERVDIGFSSDHGTKVFLHYNKEDSETDYWELAERAKKILQSYHYRVL